MVKALGLFAIMLACFAFGYVMRFNDKKRAELINVAVEHGKLHYQFEAEKWCHKNQVYVNFDEIDSAYNSNCTYCK